MVDRLLRFLPDYLENDLLSSTGWIKTGSHGYSLRCFYGLWYLVSELGLNKNYLKTQEVKNGLQLSEMVKRSEIP